MLICNILLCRVLEVSTPGSMKAIVAVLMLMLMGAMAMMR
jgi:hypothetical protein